jgi:uncharacterized protein YcfL
MKIKNILAPAGWLLAAGLLATGCTTVNTVENAQKEGQRNMITDQRVISDPALNRHVFVVGVNTAMTQGGLLKAQVELLNRTHSLHRFLYKFEWFDASGMQVNSILSASIPEQIEGMESKFIFSIAPNPECKDFRLKLIDAD